MSVYDQHGWRVRFDWGLRGAKECGPGSTVVAVVDVLSFTTAVSVAVERGIEVLPYRWRDETAAEYARKNDAVLAVGRSEAGPGDVSLSPPTLRATDARRVVLPSPNGSTIAQSLAELGCEVVAVSLRNASAVARWARDRIGGEGTVLAIAAGEHWPEGGLRPAVEDLWGAGAFLAALHGAGLTEASPEARSAAAAYVGMGEPKTALEQCAGGRELAAYGYPEDVVIAAEADTSGVVPLLSGDRFTPAH
ncbi:MAG TPA: 2-phosphosulfolactate phosphatase [Kribbellaceae bacterium]|nr:2-phosphosulfolactate phosphatase [Kribbellaceae bacterium]